MFETTFEQEESDDDVEHVFAVEKKRQDAENEKPGCVGGGHKIGVWTRDEHTSNIHGEIRAQRRPQHKHVKRYNRSENLHILKLKNTQNKTKTKNGRPLQTSIRGQRTCRWIRVRLRWRRRAAPRQCH